MAAPSAAATLATELPAPKPAPAPRVGVSSPSALAKVFHSQPPAAKAAIVRGALANPSHPASAAVLKLAAPKAPAAKDFGSIPRVRDTTAVPKAPKPSHSSGILSDIGHTISGAFTGAEHLVGEAIHNEQRQSQQLAALTEPKKGGGLIGAVAGAGASAGGLQEAAKIGGNAVKDAWQLPAMTTEGLYGIGQNLAEGKVGAAFHMFVDPYIQMAEHPFSTFVQHPLDTYLMGRGVEAVAGHALGGAMRSGALGDTAKQAASRVREPLHLGTIGGKPSPIVDLRDYTGNVIEKQIFQKGYEGYLRSKGLDPNVSQDAFRFVPRWMAQSLGVGTEARLNRLVDEAAGSRTMIGRVERQQTLKSLYDAAKAHKGPKEALPVVSHILQGIVRSPDTAVEDFQAELNRLNQNRPGNRTGLDYQNRLQARDVSKALKTPGAIDRAFAIAQDVRPLGHVQDKALLGKGFFGSEDQAIRARVGVYAKTHMGAKYDPKQGALVKADGSPLPTDEILAHIKASGTPDPMFVGHYPNKAAAFRFWKAYKLSRGTLEQNRVRTYQAFDKGAYDHSFEGIAGQMAQRSELLRNASSHDRVASTLGIKKPQNLIHEQVKKLGAQLQDGKISREKFKSEVASLREGNYTPQEAKDIAFALTHDDNGNPIPGSTELTPMSLAPKSYFGNVQDLQHPHELDDLPGYEIKQVADAVSDAKNRSDNARNVTLIPKIAADRFTKQFEKASGRSFTKYTQQFRQTVLPYSTHWMAQIGSEAVLRGLVAGVFNPRDLVDGRRLMARLNATPEGRGALTEMLGGTNYHQFQNLQIHNPNPNLATRVIMKSPLRPLIEAHKFYARNISNMMHSFESQFRIMGLGKISHRDIQDFSRSWSNSVRAQGAALDELAKRLTSGKQSTALVAKFGREIDDTFGKYSKLSPKVRAATQSWAPFLPWYLNAAKFVLWSLPAKHPVAAALMASLRQTMDQDIKDGKQLPLNAYAMQELSRLTPFNVFSPASSTPSATGVGEGLGQLAGAGLPQISGAYNALHGLNVFGSGPLKGPTGDVKAYSGPALGSAFNQIVQSFLPLARYAEIAREGGKKSYATSTLLKPQPEPGGGKSSVDTVLNRIVNPFYSFEASKKAPTAPAYAGKSASGGAAPPPPPPPAPPPPPPPPAP